MDAVYKSALVHRAELELRLARIVDFIELYDELSSMRAPSGKPSEMANSRATSAENERRDPAGEHQGAHHLATASAPEARPRRLETTPAMIIDAAKEAIRRAGVPMSRKEIVEAIAADGVVVDVANPTRHVGSIMWRYNDQIIHLEGHGYWLRDQPFEPAGYLPASGARRSGRMGDD